ncbi:hypothetical protein [Streptomyces sp. NPDC006879]|uniref:hypothetical protein n=1 Tax=Streptomyces sp. NPDC006879 TaxID=3364767 RepID=UPI0036BC9053
MTGQVHTTFASPLTLLREWLERPDSAPLREFLLLGYTVDLPFLEEVALPVARALGARVAVLGDAGVAGYEAVNVRQAGRGYLHGLAGCDGSFHPKIALLLGDHAARLAVGSGNPTQTGWGSNDELWTVVETEEDASHAVLADLADWLHDLPHVAAMTPWWAEHLEELAEELTRRHIEAPEDPAGPVEPGGTRLVHNLKRPLLQQLNPTGPVGELRLYAPYVDPTGATLRALADHFAPKELVLALQPRWSSYDSGGIREAFAGHPTARVHFLEESRVRHGKLIEWRDRAGWHAFAGSANLTRAALWRAAGEDQANCELAVLSHGMRPLLPDGTRARPASQLTGSTLATAGRRRERPSLVLLGARTDGRRVEAVLGRRPQDGPVRIEISPDGSAGTWEVLGVVPEGALSAVFPAATATAGAAVRASFRTADGSWALSAVAHLHQPRSSSPREPAQPAVPRVDHPYSVEELLVSPQAGRRFEDELGPLRDRLAEEARIARGVDGPLAPTEDWADYLRACRTDLGAPLTALAFGVLDLSTRELPGAAPGWVPTVPTDPEQWPVLRNWIRRLARRLADEASEAPVRLVPVHLVVANLYLRLLAAGAWPEHDYTWRVGLADLASALTAPRPEHARAEPPQQRRRSAGVLAVVMSLLGLHEALDGIEADPASAAAWTVSRETVAGADPADVQDLLTILESPASHVVGGEDLEALIERARSFADPIAQARQALAEAGLSASYEDGIWEVTGSFVNATPIAAKAATVLAGELPGPVLVRAEGRGPARFVAWSSPDLVLLTGRSTWRGYRISPPATPATRFGEGLPQPVAEGRAAIALLQRLLEPTDLDHPGLVRKLFTLSD